MGKAGKEAEVTLYPSHAIPICIMLSLVTGMSRGSSGMHHTYGKNDSLFVPRQL